MNHGSSSKFRVDENETDRVSEPRRSGTDDAAEENEPLDDVGEDGLRGEIVEDDDDFDRESVCLRDLTDEEFEELITEAFNDVDEENSGVIASEHLGSILDALCEDGVIAQLYSDYELDLLKNDMDADQNGMIPLSEYKDVLMRRREGVDFTEDELREAFGVFNFKEQGTITQIEYRQIMQAVLEMEVPALDAKSMILAASRNGQDKIDFDEFTEIIRWQRSEPD